MADFALSVKLWPAWPPEESPVTVSGMVESVEAMVGLMFWGCFWVLMLGVGSEVGGLCSDVREGGS